MKALGVVVKVDWLSTLLVWICPNLSFQRLLGIVVQARSGYGGSMMVHLKRASDDARCCKGATCGGVRSGNVVHFGA